VNKKKKVLLAEDDQGLVTILEKVLKKNYELGLSYDGAQTLKMVREFEPDVVVLDIMMPYLDGLHICQQIRQDRGQNDRPKILLLSARATEQDRQLGIAAGADDYITKPFRIDDLLKRIDDLAKG